MKERQRLEATEGGNGEKKMRKRKKKIKILTDINRWTNQE